jgi:hypothetical protein
VLEAEACSDVLGRFAFHDDSADRFVAALLGQLGIDKELLPTRVVHDRTSKMSFNCWLERPKKDTRNSPYRSRAPATEERKKLEIISRNAPWAPQRLSGTVGYLAEKPGRFAEMM